MNKIIKQIGLLITLSLLTTVAGAEETAAKSSANTPSANNPAEKIFINADHMKLDMASGLSVYTGNVKISQGELILTGDKVTLKQINNELKQFTVIGNPARYNHVTNEGEAIKAQSEKMVYIASQNKLVMTKNAQLTQSDHHISSQKIVYDTEKKIVIAGNNAADSHSPIEPAQRVKITLTPKKDTDSAPLNE